MLSFMCADRLHDNCHAKNFTLCLTKNEVFLDLKSICNYKCNGTITTITTITTIKQQLQLQILLEMEQLQLYQLQQSQKPL